MNEQLSAAFTEWLSALCSERPLVVVLEDFHWADPPSVVFVYRALEALMDAPLMVLALARPEVTVSYRKLWEQPLESYSVKRREELRAGMLRTGDVFVVLNHVQKGDLLWVHVRSRDDPSLTGFFKSPSDDPVRATKLE